ncbi:MAG: four helix bundle protein [Planctomycetota bacterium]|jgi:four helix bundle protein
MKDRNAIREKSFEFAIQVVPTCQDIRNRHHEFVLSKQVLRSGTSIGANVEEAIGGASKRDFLAKITIAYKEARETRYWLRLLKSCNYLAKEKADNMLESINELARILSAIQRTTKKKQGLICNP